MGTKHNDCCCCPNCTYRVELCCPCVCPAICVTFTPDDYADCDPESVELDWDNDINGYSGSLAGHDLYYFIERDPPAEGQERGPCKFKLRSESLGYPEGYEYEWEIPCDPYDEEVPCTTCLALQTEIAVPADEYNECAAGTITTECVQWITPTTCDNAKCLCECICVFITKDDIRYSGRICWDEYLQKYTGTVTGQDDYNNELSLEVEVPIDRWGDVCDPDDPECDPYSDKCAINLIIIEGETETSLGWQQMVDPSELDSVTYAWDYTTPEYDTITANIRCSSCPEDCASLSTCDCEGTTLPSTLTLTFHSTSGRAVGLEGCSITLNWFEHAGGLFGNPGGCFESDATTCCNTSWVWRLCCDSTFFPATLTMVQGSWTSGHVTGYGKESALGATCDPFFARFGPFNIMCSDLTSSCGPNLMDPDDPCTVDGEYWIDVTE